MTRGLFRIWIVITALWLVFLYTATTASGFRQIFREVEQNPDVTFGPPLALLALGAGLVWAARGFKVR